MTTVEQPKLWGQECQRCPERTAHKLRCCAVPMCCSCQHVMETKFHPFVSCPWCNAEILPFEVVLAREHIPKYLAKLATLQANLVAETKVLETFELERAEHLKKQRQQRRRHIPTAKKT